MRKKMLGALHEINGLMKSVSLRMKLKCRRQQLLIDGIKGNKKFENKHEGERCFILGNGPSIKDQDLRVLSNEVVFSVNRFFLHEDVEIIKPAYHFFADPYFYSEMNVNEMRTIMAQIERRSEDLIVFFPAQGYEFKKKYLDEYSIEVNYYLPTYSIKAKRIRYNYAKAITGFNTVVQYAVTMAIYMGFKEIYLLGCDNTGILEFCSEKLNDVDLGGGHFYSEKTKMDYSAASIFYGWGAIFEGYEILSRFCKDKKIEIINATKGGIMDGVERLEFEELFK